MIPHGLQGAKGIIKAVDLKNTFKRQRFAIGTGRAKRSRQMLPSVP